jgi:hypothetical protein
VSIPEETIMKHLDSLLTSSEPGDILHHLHVLFAADGAVGPFGIPTEEQLQLHVYAIAPVGPDVEPEEFVLKSMAAAGVQHRSRGEKILFAAMNQEMWEVGREDFDDHARDLLKQGRLEDHPDSVEVTVVYAVARDGRRWLGRRWLTGPKAGQTGDLDLIVGAPRASEAFGLPFATVLRRLVGMRS